MILSASIIVCLFQCLLVLRISVQHRIDVVAFVEIYSFRFKRGEFFYKSNEDERFAFVDFGIYLRRRHTFYVVNVILPSIMTSVLLLSIFFCTPAQKVNANVKYKCKM